MKISLALVALVATAPARADVIWNWTEIAIASGAKAKHLAFVQSRTMAMMHVAMFEAINATDGPYRSYLQRIPSAPGVAAAAIGATSGEERHAATAAVAAHEVLVAVFPEQKAVLDAALEKSLADVDAGAREAAISQGRATGAAVVSLRAGDGSAAPNTVRPR